jgi:hypothetical protein
MDSSPQMAQLSASDAMLVTFATLPLPVKLTWKLTSVMELSA